MFGFFRNRAAVLARTGPVDVADARKVASLLHSTSASERLRLLKVVIENGAYSRQVIYALVNANPEHYRVVLSLPDPYRLRLTPLESGPSESWIQLATMAVGMGVAPCHIAAAAFTYARSQVSDIPGKYVRAASEWAQLRKHGDVAIARLATMIQKLNEDAANGWPNWNTRFAHHYSHFVSETAPGAFRQLTWEV